MWRKSLIFLSILVLTISIAIGCATPTTEALPTPLSLEESIKQILITKGKNYNFLEDEAYMEHMKTLSMELVNNKLAEPPHYAIGNLDDDNIPELAIFQERDPDDMDDEGSLEIYKFNGEKYVIIDEVSMNYDNTNYQIVIGAISKNQNGLLLNNSVGAHASIVYGFRLENNKLSSIFNEQKITLVSIYSNNEIKDIDGDDILEFSIYTVDPETQDSSSAGSDKMTLWYKWDGKDSANLVNVDRKDYSKEISDEGIFNQGDNLIHENPENSLEFMTENKNKLSKYHNTELLKKYIERLDAMAFDSGVEVNNIFATYYKDNNFDYLLEKYGLNLEQFIENLNNIEYLKREKVLKDEEKLKEHLINHIDMGYKLESSEGLYYYVIDYQKFVDIFGEDITNEYEDYLRILALDTNEPHMNDGSLTISMEKLAERILFVESFKMVYPYSELLPNVKSIYDLYLYSYFYGDVYVPNYEDDTFKIKEEVLIEFDKAMEKYSYTNFANLISTFKELLKENNYIVNDNLRHKFEEWLN